MRDSIEAITHQFQAATKEFFDRLAALREDVATKQRELAAALKAHVSPAERDANIQRYIKKQAAIFIKRMGPQIVCGDRGFGRADLQVGQTLPWSAEDGTPWGLQCLTEPDRVFKMLASACDQAPSYKPGPSSEDREAINNALRTELSTLEAAEEQIVDEMLVAGLTVKHRPEVVARRQQEARAQELRDAANAEALERQQAIDNRQTRTRRNPEDEQAERQQL